MNVYEIIVFVMLFYVCIGRIVIIGIENFSWPVGCCLWALFSVVCLIAEIFAFWQTVLISRVSRYNALGILVCHADWKLLDAL